MDTQPTEKVLFLHPEILSTGSKPIAIQSLSENAQLSSSVDHPARTFIWKQVGSKVNRLEVQAAFSLSVNILPFWLCTFPVSCFAMATYWCTRFEGDCDTFLLLWTYLWDFFMLHSIYNPLMYMISCREFRRALFHTTAKWVQKINVQIQNN